MATIGNLRMRLAGDVQQFIKNQTAVMQLARNVGDTLQRMAGAAKQNSDTQQIGAEAANAHNIKLAQLRNQIQLATEAADRMEQRGRASAAAIAQQRLKAEELRGKLKELETGQHDVATASDKSAKEITQSGNAAHGAGGKMEKAAGGTDRLKTAFSAMAGVIAGAGIVGMLSSIGGGLVNLGKQAFETVGANERLGMSIQTMLAKQIQDQSVVTTRTLIGHKNVLVTEGAVKATVKHQKSAEELSLIQNRLNTNIAVANERLNEAIAKGKESAAEIQQRKNAIAGMQYQLNNLTAGYGSEGVLVSKQVALYKTETVTTKDLATARKEAALQTAEYMKWIAKTAVESPFSKEGVGDGFKMALAAGFSADEAKRLTMANLNLSAAMGDSGEMMQRVQLVLGQVRNKGKLTGEEMMQMMEAGVNMREMLLSSGKVAGLTAENFDKMQAKGLIPAQAAIEAYTEYVEKNYGTAAKDQASSLAGLTNSLEDLKLAALANIFEPMFKQAQPYIDKFVTRLQDPATVAMLQQIGQVIGTTVGGALQFIASLASAGMSGGAPGLLGALGVAPDTVAWVMSTFATIQGYAVQFVAFVIANLPLVLATATQVWQGIKSAGETYVIPFLQFLIGQGQRVVAWVNDNWPLIQQTVNRVLTALGLDGKVSTDEFVKTVEFAFNTIKMLIDTALTIVMGVVKAAMQAINGDWSGAWQTLKTAAFDVWESIKQWFGTWPEEMKKAGVNMMTGLLDGINNAKGQVLGALIGLWDSIKQYIFDTFKIKSPSRWFFNRAGDMMRGMSLGFDYFGQEMTGVYQRTMAKIMAPDAFEVTPAFAGGGGGGGPVINFYDAQVRKDSDIDRIAAAVARRLK